ncbi:PorV/PorQ family protein [candidate division KSB1 bacterium]|nr:PorV/PorQ family protein [candidate division KSB1 bacterium]
MRDKSCLIWVAVAAFALSVSLNLYAGNRDRAGTAAAEELLIPVGGRDMAMGGASIATTTGIDAIFWNPAGLARTPYSADAMFFRFDYFAGINVNYVAIAGSFGKLGTAAISFKSLEIGDIPITTEDAPDGTGAVLDPTFFIAGLNYSLLLTERISVGFNLKVINEDLTQARVQGTGFAFSAGVQYKNAVGIRGLDLGIAVKNIGPQFGLDGEGLINRSELEDARRGSGFTRIDARSEDLPSTIDIGVSYTVNVNELNGVEFAGQFVNNNFRDDEARFGVEYNYDETFFLRGGFSSAPDAPDDTFIFGSTVGAGVNVNLTGLALRVDYTYMDVDFFDNLNAVSIKVGF